MAVDLAAEAETEVARAASTAERAATWPGNAPGRDPAVVAAAGQRKMPNFKNDTQIKDESIILN